MRKSIDELSRTVAVDPSTAVFAGAGPVALLNADFDGDGKLDLAVLNVSSGLMTLCRGDGRGGFHRPASNVTDCPSSERLTARETEVATLITSGYTDREMATMLGIGRRTVETHTANVRAKLGLKSRRELQRGAVWPARDHSEEISH